MPTDVNKLSKNQILKLESEFLAMKEEAKNDPVFFFDNFLYTFDPRVEPFNLPFKTYPFQKRLIRDVIAAIDGGEDIFIEKCRDMGATYVILGVFIWMWLFRPSTAFLLGSRKEQYVDNRKGGLTGTKEESLFGKVDYMLSKLPHFILPEGFNANKHFNYMSLINPENGSSMTGESSNDNFGRGSRKTAVLYDEFAFWDNANQSWSGTANTTNCRIALTTPGSKPSKAKRLRFGKDGEQIKIITLTYNLDPRKNKRWLDEQRKRFSEEDFNREVMINWDLSLQGIIYPEINRAVYGDYPFIPNTQVYCSGDYGLDGTAFGFWQQNPDNGKWRLIDSFHYEEEPIEYSFPIFGRPIDSAFIYPDEKVRDIERLVELPPAIHFGDPSINKRSGNKDKESDRDKLAKIKVLVGTYTDNNSIEYRVKSTKLFLQDGIEINDTPSNEYAYESLKGYRWKTWEEDHESTAEFRKPIHNWTSHFSTSVEYLAVNLEHYKLQTEEPPSWANRAKKWITNKSKMKGGYDRSSYKRRY